MEINEGWYRYHYHDTQDSSGRLRLVRQGGVFSGYYWGDGEATPTPQATQGSATDSLSVTTTTGPQEVDTQLAAGWDRESLGCPTAPATATWAAVQPFERGLTLWQGDTRQIYVLVDLGPWLAMADEWRDTAILILSNLAMEVRSTQVPQS
jgi:hypothetical protein